MRFRIHDAARAEANEAVEYYERRRADLGHRFMYEVREAYALIRRDPTAMPLYEIPRTPRGIRRQLLSSFPYIVVFAAFEDEIIVFAIAHTARKPGYWRDRLH
jgi:toxin ParE1/3/4